MILICPRLTRSVSILAIRQQYLKSLLAHTIHTHTIIRVLKLSKKGKFSFYLWERLKIISLPKKTLHSDELDAKVLCNSSCRFQNTSGNAVKSY